MRGGAPALRPAADGGAVPADAGGPLAGGRLVAPAEVERMIAVHAPPIGGGPAPGGGDGYGYGVQIATIDGVRTIGPGGAADGINAYLRHAPALDLTAVVLANQDSPAAARVGERALRLRLAVRVRAH